MPPSDPSPASFTWNPAEYHKSSAAQQQWAQELIAKLGLRGNERVLDIGCGDGKVTAEIARNLPDGFVTGLDSSPDMIRFACDHFPRSEYRNLSFIQADARALQFSGEFDVVFSAAALHWIPDHIPVLAGIARSLRPQGKLLIQMGGKGNAEQALGAGDIVQKRPEWKEYFRDFSFRFGFFDSTEYRAWLIASGFEPLRVELIPKDMTYASRQDFAAWIRTTWLPWMSRLPENRQSGYIEAVMDEYLKKYPADSDGTIHIRMVRLEAEARKPA
ncbi:MAG: methyltransferase domain-containing protein [Methanoregula sp.]|nr:methyltransferase domain-containing protein [Methanoregula sp.]